MKKMLEKFGNSALSKADMKSIKGGCGYRCSGDSWQYGVSKASAQDNANACTSWGLSGYWCCQSC